MAFTIDRIITNYAALFQISTITKNLLNKTTVLFYFDLLLSTRSIQKLIELGYLEKLADQQDSRAYRLFLTEKGKNVIPIIQNESLSPLCPWETVYSNHRIPHL